MFLGTYTPKLDDKGRFFMPAKFRAELGAGLVITRAQDRCLAIYPLATFAEMTKQVVAAPNTLRSVRDYKRMLAASASDETLDKQGRITVPAALRTYAGLGEQIVVVGAIDRIEVWDPEAWDDYAAKQEPAFSDLNEEVFPII